MRRKSKNGNEGGYKPKKLPDERGGLMFRRTKNKSISVGRIGYITILGAHRNKNDSKPAWRSL